ncbi:MAG TPA: 4-alpha-glucanotransferase [Mycobacteriales bacterium]|nr:4-alpha-glucanotransferase [Mycobacteriales bacterium]
MTLAPDLAELAAAHGVATSYQNQLDESVDVSADAVVGVLAALGVDAATKASIAGELEAVRGRSDEPSVLVLRQGETRAVTAAGTTARLRQEDGGERELPVEDGRVLVGPALPIGWHSLVCGDAELPVAVAPRHAPVPKQRQWGLMVQLYAMRSKASWGMGDLGDLGALADWTAAAGGGLVLVNPLHATGPVPPMQNSPYYPASRRWTNPIYLRIEDTAAYAAAPGDVQARVDELRVPNDAPLVERDRTWTAKLEALELLYDTVTPTDLDRLEPALLDWATWCAIAERDGPDWRNWTSDLRRPDAPGVAAARVELAARIGLHAWLQRLCVEQLTAVHARARAAGLAHGVVHDLAVGTDPAGADAWALQDVLALGARIGAPPDTFNQQGQDWGMPPWHPARLAESAYMPLRDLLRSQLAHAGGVRIDHILGAFRMWWVPEGASPRDGTYVSYDANAFLGVAALEAHRAGAVVIGEDLGTVTPDVRTELADRGILGTSVLWFEREDPVGGRPGPLRPLDEWRAQAAASITTHDLPTALGWLRGEHVRVRAELGVLDGPDAENRDWLRERGELMVFLQEAGLLDAKHEGDAEELVLALHAAVASTPSRLVLAAPPDAIGDLRQPNLPGTVDDYPNWRLPVADADGNEVLLEDLLADSRLRRLADLLTQRVR